MTDHNLILAFDNDETMETYVMVNKAADSFLEERYFQDGEDWNGLCARVARALASDGEEYDEFFSMIYTCRGLPNSPTLMNAGTDMGYLSACNLLPVPDDLEGIMDAVKNSAMIYKHGGGAGFTFSDLRPTGDRIGSTGGVSSGVISFMKIFNIVGDVIKQGGRRRSAQLGLLRYDHPDILRWLHAKDEDGELSTFNISVGLDDEFFDTLKNNQTVIFNNPRTGKPFSAYDPALEIDRDFMTANELFDRIAKGMWRTGEPGIIFWDTIQRDNPTPHLGPIDGTNPCSETSLRFNESCVLGSINLYAHLHDGEIDHDQITKTTKVMVRLLNAVIDRNEYPLPQIERATKETRKIGIGVMGFADVLASLRVRYGSDESLEVARDIMRTITIAAMSESERLADIHGPYPTWREGEGPRRRNAALTSIAPTGSISFIAGVNGGIEPFFKMSYQMNREEKKPMVVIQEVFLDDLKRHDSVHVISDMLANDYTPIQMVRKKLLTDDFLHYVTAGEVAPREHVLVQSVFQEYVDMGISKTVNLQTYATVDEVKDIILLSHEKGCKGITVYRDKCDRSAFLTRVSCPSCESEDVEHSEGCIRCRNCGTSCCSVA